MTLDSGNRRFMRIFAGVPWRGRQTSVGNQRRRFSGFWTLHLRHLRKWGQHYYIVLFSPLSPFHWPKNAWLWMAWMDILRYIFTTTNCLWLIICYVFTAESVYTLVHTRDQRRRTGVASVRFAGGLAGFNPLISGGRKYWSGGGRFDPSMTSSSKATHH